MSARLVSMEYAVLTLMYLLMGAAAFIFIPRAQTSAKRIAAVLDAGDGSSANKASGASPASNAASDGEAASDEEAVKADGDVAACLANNASGAACSLSKASAPAKVVFKSVSFRYAGAEEAVLHE